MHTLCDVLTDVSIREGSQQEIDLRALPVSTKIDLLHHIIAAGIRKIELTAFAPGEWFSDAEELVSGSEFVSDDIILSALYFNTRGLESLLAHPRLNAAGHFHTGATHHYREKNYNQTSLEHAVKKMTRSTTAFKQYNLPFESLILSTAWGESGEDVSTDQIVEILSLFLRQAAHEGCPIQGTTLADTVGYASPQEIGKVIGAIKKEWPTLKIIGHLHPGPDKAAECVHAALDAGIDGWEASWCGLGGSPFADKPGGNLDIRILVRVYEERGLAHGINKDAADQLYQFLGNTIKRPIAELD